MLCGKYVSLARNANYVTTISNYVTTISKYVIVYKNHRTYIHDSPHTFNTQYNTLFLLFIMFSCLDNVIELGNNR